MMTSSKLDKLQTINFILTNYGFEMPEDQVDKILEIAMDNKVKIQKHHEESTSV